MGKLKGHYETLVESNGNLNWRSAVCSNSFLLQRVELKSTISPYQWVTKDLSDKLKAGDWFQRLSSKILGGKWAGDRPDMAYGGGHN